MEKPQHKCHVELQGCNLHKVNAGPDQTFQFNADMDPDPIPAPHQIDANLRPLLVYTVQTL
jgi:hypothetical protein